MDPELRGLVDTLTDLAKVEAFYREHSEDFWEVRKQILRHAHESCRMVSRRVEIHIANTEPVMVGDEDFEQQLTRAKPSAQGKRDTAGSVSHHSIQGEANESVDQPIAQEKKSISTEDHGNQGEAGNLNVPERWRPGLSPVTKVWKTIRPSVILRTQLAQSARQIPNPSQATPTETDLHIQPPRPAGQIRRKPQEGKRRREGGIVGKDDVA